MREGAPLWTVLQSLLSGKAAMFSAGIVIMLACAAVIFYMSHKMFLIREWSLLPSVMCILLFTTGDGFIPFTPGSIGALCLALSTCILLSAYQNTESARQSFLAGFIIGVGSLFWGYTLWFFPLLWIVMQRSMSLTGKTGAAALIGTGSVYWMAGGICAVTGDYDLLLHPLLTLSDIQPFSWQGVQWDGWYSMGCCILFSAIAIIHTFRRRFDENRRTQSFCLFLSQHAMLILLLASLYPAPAAQGLFQCLCIPASLFLANFFTSNRRPWKFWTFHVMVFLFLSSLFLRIVELWNLS
jgi:hypothetical protein